MLYYLDTNVILDLIDMRAGVAERMKAVYRDHEIRMSDIVYYEVLRGFRLRNAMRKFSVFMNFCKNIGIDFQTKESLELAAENYAHLTRNGITIGDDDILIGSLAIANGAVMVTNNTRHFENLPNIRLENWAT